tara:strand:+ start:1441 stop:1800 length:360 start_codon:yes stop_codon:yes gene_type:complete
MAKKKTSKPLYKSLTVQSSVLLAVLIVVRAFYPEHLNDELFSTLLAVFGLGGAVGVRRALGIIILCSMPVSAINCGPSVCEKTSIVITSHPDLPKPAGKVTVKCDGKDKAVIISKKVTK